MPPPVEDSVGYRMRGRCHTPRSGRPGLLTFGWVSLHPIGASPRRECARFPIAGEHNAFGPLAFGGAYHLKAVCPTAAGTPRCDAAKRRADPLVESGDRGLADLLPASRRRMHAALATVSGSRPAEVGRHAHLAIEPLLELQGELAAAAAAEALGAAADAVGHLERSIALTAAASIGRTMPRTERKKM